MKATYSIVSLTLVVSSLLTSPIFAGDVKTQTTKGADFAHYQTYEWFPPRVLTKVGEVENHPANPVIKEVVGQQLTQKGLREVAAGSGDLQIQVTVLTDTTPQLEAVVYAFFPGDMTSTQIASIGRYNRAGTLYVNLIDRRTQKSAWVAMASESLPMGELKPELIRSKLDSAAKSMFKKYPAKR
jgi:Domain of unknown function (DUF4136)